MRAHVREPLSDANRDGDPDADGDYSAAYDAAYLTARELPRHQVVLHANLDPDVAPDRRGYSR
jgi:hypothetical protein